MCMEVGDDAAVAVKSLEVREPLVDPWMLASHVVSFQLLDILYMLLFDILDYLIYSIFRLIPFIITMISIILAYYYYKKYTSEKFESKTTNDKIKLLYFSY